ncbi:MAG: Ig-like domain-containing protein [Erysipelotrichaceae bacterium]|nr:Ig-like domain-containing protein [Erysipelotrichaceae bacterium]
MVRQKRKTMSWLFSILLCISQMNVPVRAEDELLPAEEEEQVILEDELQEEEEPAVVITENPETEEVQEEPVTEEPEEEIFPEEPAEELPAEDLSDPDETQEEQPQETEELPSDDLPEETVTEEPAESESFESVYVDASEYMLQAGAILKEEEEYSEAYATTASFDLRTDFAALNAVFQRGVSQWETSVNVASFNIPTSEASKVYGYLTNANPQFFYLSNRFSYSYNSSNCIVSLNLEYDTAYTRADSETFENRVNEITAGVDASWSDTQKALYLHDVLVIDNTYDLTYSNYNAYNALIDRTSVCQGYSLAYKYLLNKVGIESDIISCESFNHAWNTVVVDGTTYFVDSTWDDPIKTYRMRCKHTNFLRDRDGLLDTGHIKDDGTDAKDWVNSFGENIYNSYLTDYPNAYWANCITQIPHIGNSWFYPDSSGNIFRFNGNTGSTSVLTTLSDYWYTIDQSGYWGRYIHLDVFEDKLVASQEGSVYLIDMSGNLTSVGTLTDAEYNSARIYGIQTQGNKVRYDLYESPNASQLYNFGYFVLKEFNPVTGISLNRTTLSFSSIGSTATLTATVLPSNATDKSVTWRSSNTNVATVNSSGMVTAVGSGTAVITAVSSDPSITAQCSVTVTIAVQSVSVSPETAQMFTGEKLQLQAAVLPSAASDKTVTWKSSNTAVATVDSTGKVTAVSNGTATITATTRDGGYSDTCIVSVSTPLVEVYLNTDSLRLIKGETSYLTVSFVPETASDHTVAWSSSDPSIAAVDSTGKVTAVSNGTAVITVTANDGGFTDTCTVTVTTPLNGIALNKHTLLLNKNNTETLTVSFDPEDASDQTVVWSSSDPSAVSVDQNGTVTALKGGSAVITVISSDGNHSDTCTVTVTVPVTGITLSQNTLSLNKGDTYQLASNIQPADATDKTVTWQSSDTAVAAVDNTGKVTAVSNGTAAITATSNDGGYTDTCTVTVTTPLTGITLNTHAITLEKTKSQTLLVAFSPEDASNKNVTWSSSDPQIASVSSSGTVTARGAGTAVITVVSQYGSYSDSCTVTVTSPLRGIHPDVHELQLSKGESYTVTVMYDPEDTTDDRTLRWISQDTTVAKVDSNGTITGVGAGFTKVTVSLKSGRFANTINVFVNIPAEGIELSEHELTMNKGTSQSVQAEFYPQGAETQNVIWSSSDESVVTVDADGTFNAVGKGTAVVTVTSEDGAFTDTCSVTVRVPVEEIYITGSGTELKVGQTMSLSLTVLPEDADRENIFWFSLNPEIASVDQNGTVTGISEGETVIGVKAAADQIQVDVGIRVVPDVVSVTGIMLSEHALTLETGGNGQLTAYVTPEDASNKKVYWTSADPSVATVDEQGNIRAVGDGQTTITVATDDGGYTDTCMVTVSTVIPLRSIQMDQKEVFVYVGDTFRQTVTFDPENTTDDKTLTWSSSDPEIASVDQNGTIKGLSTGTASIIVKTADGTLTDTCTVTVSEYAKELRLSETSLSLNAPPEIFDLDAFAGTKELSADEVIWTSSDQYTVSVDENGTLQAIWGGTVIITATLVSDETVSAVCEVTVDSNMNVVRETENAHILNPGEEYDLKARFIPEYGAAETIEWQTSDPSVAEVDNNGHVTALSSGTAVVSVSLKKDGHIYRRDCEIYVIGSGYRPVSQINLNLMNYTDVAWTGSMDWYTAYVYPDNASVKAVNWKSSDYSVADVDPDGYVYFKDPGVAYVWCEGADGNVYQERRIVSLPEGSVFVKGFEFDTHELTVGIGRTVRLPYHFTPSDATNQNLSWTVDHEEIVEVQQDGTIVGLREGTTYVHALTEAGDFTDSCKVTVTSALPAEPIISDSTAELVARQTKQLSVEPGEEGQVIGQITWASDDQHVAVVDDNGLVTAVAGGDTVVHAYVLIEGIEFEVTCSIHVTGDPYVAVEEVVIAAEHLTLLIGDGYHLTGYVRPSNATNHKLTWTSDNENAVTVDETGYVKAVGTGTATIRVSSEDGAYAECSATAGWWITSITLEDTDITLTRGDTYQIVWTILPEEASDHQPIFKTNREDVLTIDENGLITTIGVGPALVTVESPDPERMAKAYLTVYVKEKDPDPVPVISDSTMTLNPYGKRQLTVRSWDTEHVIDRVEWESDDTFVAEVDENGLVTAVAGGTTLIHGHVFIGEEEYEVTCTVQVTGDPYTPVSEIQLSAGQLFLMIGDSYHLSAQYLPENASRKKVSWSSDNEAVATVDENGNVTAVGTGTAVILASSPDGVYAECPVTAGWWITSITLAETDITLTRGDTYQIVWTIEPEQASDHQPVFKTDREDVLTIDENGLITTIGVGPALVTVESPDPERQAKAYLKVYVQDKEPDYIPVTSMYLNVGGSYGFSEVGSSSGFTAYCLPQDATDQRVTWSTSNPNVASVDVNGNVMAMGAGEADITATCRDGVSVTCHVTVDASEEGKHVIGDYIYYLTDSEAYLIGYINKPSDVIIPAYVNDLPVTSIGKSVFENHTEIETVTLPDTMLRIGSYAFMGCSNLNSISFGNSLQEIGPGAFLDCGSLTSISLPASLSRENDIDWEYSEGPFSNCWNLREVTFGQEDSGSSFWMIPDGLFRDCSGLVEITLPKSVISIGTYAFAHCVNLTTIHLPENMERIGRGAFEWCENLERLDGLNYLYEAGPYAFNMCYQLKEAEFAASLSHLADGLFRNCESLTSITLSSQVLNEDDSYGMSPFDGDYHLEEVNILQDVIPEYGAVPAGLFRGCTGLRFFEIPSFVRKIRNNAFEDTGLQSIVIPDSVEEIEEYAFRNCRDLVNVTLSKNLKTLPSGLFSGCTSLEEIELPASLSGNEADGSPYEGPFSYCSSLKTVTFAEGFKVIPGKLFKDCTGLRQIHIPESVTHIGENTFENTQLTDVWMTCFLEKVGDHAFDLSETAAHGLHVHYTGTPEQWRNLTIGINNEPLTYNEPDYSVPIESITFDPSEYVIYSGIVYEFIPVIKPETYSSVQLVWSSSDNEIASVDETGHIIAKAQGEAIITASLGSVSGSLKVTVAERVHFDYIWNDDDSITITKFSGTEEHLVIPLEIAGHPVTQIGEGAFKDNLMLRSVELPYTVKEIGTEAFAGCTVLEAVNLSSGVTKIGDRAFYGCSSLDHVVMPDTVTVMGEQVFACCEGLTDIHLSESLTEIPAQSFYNCTSLAEIVIPDQVTLIGEQAFEGCSLLQRAVLPASLTTVETGAFNEVPEEITVEYNGRRYLWEQIDFSEGNEIIQTAEVICHPAEEDKIPAETPVIRYQDDYGVLNKATGETTVKEGTVVSLISAGEGELRYTLDGSDPVSNGIPYTSEIILKFEYGSRIIVKTAVIPSGNSEYRSSSVAEAVFLRKENTWQEDPGDVTRPDAEEVSEVIPEGIWVTGTDQEFVYNGKAQTFSSLKVYDGNKLLKKNTDYTVKYTDNLHTYGTPLLTITGKGNYTETIGIPFVIRQADLAEAAASDLSVTYTAALKDPSPVVSYNGLKLREGTDYVIENRPFTSELEEGGIFELVLTGINDFYGTRTVMMYVSPEVVRTVAVSKVSSSKIAPVPFVKGQKVDPASLTTTGGAPLSFKYSKKELNEDQYTLSVTNDEKPGTAYLVICGTGIPDESGTAFTGTKKISFKISGPAIQTSIRAAETVFPYDGLTKSLVLLDNETDEVLTEGTDYTIAWNKKPVNAGKYTAAIKGITYTGSMKLAVTVTPVTENITYSYSSQYVKGGNPAVTVRCGGLLLKKGTDYTVTYGKLTGLTQTMTIKMKGNYSGTFSETATFDPKDLSEVTMSVKDSAYSSKAGKNYVQPVLTDTNGKVLKAGTDYEKPVSGSEAYTYVKDTQVTVGTGTKAVKEYRAAGEAVRKTDIIPAGTMIRVTAKAKGNYTGSISAVYMVISAVNRLTGAKVTVKETYEYTGKAIVPSVNDIEVILKDGTVLSPEDFEIISVSGNIKPTKKAKVTVRGVNGRGYGGTASGLFTIVRQAMELTAEETENTYNH